MGQSFSGENTPPKCSCGMAGAEEVAPINSGKNTDPPKCNCGAAEEVAPNTSHSIVRCCVKQRLWSLLQNKSTCDVCFIVGFESNAKKIYAHKAILMVASSVFEVMFSENWSSESNEVEIPDIEPSVFSAMLRFIYTDEIRLRTDSVIKVLYAARKYALLTLVNRCVYFLKDHLTPSNACLTLMHARLFDQPKLEESCLKVIDKNPEATFSKKSFTDLDVTALCAILKRDSLEAPELYLFSAILRWSTAECWRQGLPVNAENQKLVLKDVLPLIRFPLMTQKEFAASVLPHHFLSNEEVLDLFVYFSDDPKPSTKFNAKPRLKKQGKEPKMWIYVNTMTGKAIPVEVKNSDTVQKVMYKIEDTENIPPCQQRLKFHGRQLRASQILSVCDVQRGATIQMQVQPRIGPCPNPTLCCSAKMSIIVKQSTGKNFTLAVRTCDTIEDVKDKIENQHGIPSGQQCLTFASRRLEDTRTLSDYNIPKGSSVDLLLQSI